MRSRLLYFFAASLAFGAITFAAAWLLLADHRESTAVCSPVALALCLVPSVATLAWSSWGLTQSYEQQLTAVLGGTGLRMFVVLAAGLFLSLSVPFLHAHTLAFWIWVLLYYLATLGLEMFLLVRSHAAAQQPATAEPQPPASR